MYTRKRKTTKRHPGSWIIKSRRLAIYLRDGFACVYCLRGVEDGITLTLDHITPWVYFGSNKSSNLVTCCRRCNSKRGDSHLKDFASTDAIRRVNRQRRKDITGFWKMAKKMIADRK